MNFPVDIVYTWVDNKDPIWKEKKEKALNEITYDIKIYDFIIKFQLKDITNDIYLNRLIDLNKKKEIIYLKINNYIK